RECGLPERDVERVPTALLQRGQDREGGVHPGRVVDQRDADPDARAARLARHRYHAAGGLEQRVVPGQVALRPGWSVGRDRAVDELGLPRPYVHWAEAELRGEPGAQALDDDVGAVDEARHHFAAAAKVECERPLARVDDDEQGS